LILVLDKGASPIPNRPSRGGASISLIAVAHANVVIEIDRNVFRILKDRYYGSTGNDFPLTDLPMYMEKYTELIYNKD